LKWLEPPAAASFGLPPLIFYRNQMERTNTMASAAQITANRANAQLSTGPRSPEGKARSSQNAQRSGLFAAVENLVPPLRARYQEFLSRYQAEFSPATDRERELLAQLALAAFRCDRALLLQMGFFQEKVRSLCERRAIPIPDDPFDYMHLEAVVLAEEPGAIRAADRLLRWQTTFEREMRQLHDALARLVAGRHRAERAQSDPEPPGPERSVNPHLDLLDRQFGYTGFSKTKPIAHPRR
jgi:hypothetical protein